MRRLWPSLPVLPEIPPPALVAKQVAALADPAPVREWLRGHRVANGVPPVPFSLPLAGKFLFDEWSLQVESVRGRMRVPTEGFRRRLRDELEAALDLYDERGWIDDPRSFHRDPPALGAGDVTLTWAGMPTNRFEHLRWSSGYEPWEGEPGRDRWLEYRRNHTAHAYLLRHDGGPRPWILCINGYRTGDPVIDLWAFRARHLHRRLGLNVAVLVQPLHGPRSAGSISGDRVLYGGALNLIHTTTQAAWDARRLISWIRDVEEAPAVGVQGLSLGGYVTAMLCGLEPDLACVVAGIPESDIVRGLRRTVEPMLPPYYEQWGLSWAPTERVTSVCSPLALDPVVPTGRRFIYAGLADRWVRPGNVAALWEHWDRCEIHWYPGSHLSVVAEPSVHRFVDRVLTATLG
jgi:hypothetical protein